MKTNRMTVFWHGAFFVIGILSPLTGRSATHPPAKSLVPSLIAWQQVASLARHPNPPVVCLDLFEQIDDAIEDLLSERGYPEALAQIVKSNWPACIIALEHAGCPLELPEKRAKNLTCRQLMDRALQEAEYLVFVPAIQRLLSSKTMQGVDEVHRKLIEGECYL